MRRHAATAIAMALLVAIAGCGEKPQTIGDIGAKDTAAFHGTGSTFVAPGWKPGDKTSWEQHLQARMQRGQNDYAKAN